MTFGGVVAATAAPDGAAVLPATAEADASAAVPAADIPPGGGTADAPSPYFELSMVSDSPLMAPYGTVDITFTVTNHGRTAPAAGDVLLVSVSWDATAIAADSLGDSGPQWAQRVSATSGAYVPTWDDRPRPGSACVLAGMSSTSTTTGSCTMRLRGYDWRLPDEAHVTASILDWAWPTTIDSSTVYVPRGASVDHPSASVGVGALPSYVLSADARPFGAASGPDVIGEFTVETSPAAVAGWTDAQLEVVLRGPDGWTVSDAQVDLPGCTRDGAALRCTVENANRVPAPTSETDTTLQTIASYDVAFSPPGWSSPKEDFSEFTSSAEGWYQVPVIGLAIARSGAVPAAAAAIVLPPGGYEMSEDWFETNPSPFATLAQVFPTTTEVDPALTGVGDGDTIEATFTVTHDEAVTTELPGVAVTFELSWPDFLSPTGDPVGCDEWVAPRCTISGMDDPGIVQDVTMEFEATAAGTGRSELTGVDVTLPDGDGEISFGPSWIGDSFDFARALTDVFLTQVTLDRDATRVEGEPLLATVRVQWAKEIGPRYSRAIFVQFELDWGDRVELVDPPGIEGCSELDDRVCTLTEWDQVGEVREITLELDPAKAGEVVVRAIPVFVGFGVPNDASTFPLSWFSGDEASARVIDARFGVGLTLDRNPGYRGGQPLRATATVSRPSAPGVAPADDAPLRSSATTLDFTWPAYLTLTAVEGCPTFSGHRCVLTGLDAAGASAAVTLVFTMPAPITGDPDPRTDELTVAVAGASYDVVEASLPDPPPPPDPPGSECEIGFAAAADPCCPPGTDACPIPPLPEPVLTTVRTDAPAAWLDDDRASFSLLQPRAWITPAVANPGEVVTLHTQYLPPGEVVASQWRLPQPGQTASMPGVAVVGAPAASPGSTDVLLLRWTLAGPRAVTLSSTVGTFGAITSKPVLVAPRSAMAPGLVGRGG
ncbi:hypothetical protein ACWKWP_15975 [Agromyces soli]